MNLHAGLKPFATLRAMQPWRVGHAALYAQCHAAMASGVTYKAIPVFVYVILWGEGRSTRPHDLAWPHLCLCLSLSHVASHVALYEPC